MQGARITDPKTAREFVLAGDARFTLVSIKTGARYTYRVARADGAQEMRPWFVGLLNGPDNIVDYEYLGCIWPNGLHYAHGHKSPVRESAPSVQAVAWLIRQLAAEKLPDTCELWHEGRCGRCGRPLTVPESIATGIGPVCAGM